MSKKTILTVFFLIFLLFPVVFQNNFDANSSLGTTIIPKLGTSSEIISEEPNQPLTNDLFLGGGFDA